MERQNDKAVVVTEANKHSIGATVGDAVYYAELKRWYTNNALRTVSIKCILEGEEHYEIGKQHYRVQGGHYLVATKQEGAKGYFDSGVAVKSICVDLSFATLDDVYRSWSAGTDPDGSLLDYLHCPEFFENVSSLRHGLLGAPLQALYCRIQAGDLLLTDAVRYRLAEGLLAQEVFHRRGLTQLEQQALSSRKETLRRLKTAVDYMEENFLTIADIGEVAAHAYLSKYHFFRCFRTVYGVTPHRFLLERKMKLALSLLGEPDHNISQVALLCNYTDVYSFSKAFKKFYGLPPLQHRRQWLRPVSGDE